MPSTTSAQLLPELRIALVSNRYAPSVGGVQHHVQRVAEELSRRGHLVTVLTHELDDGAPPRERVVGVEVRRFLPVIPCEHFLLAPGLGRHLARSHEAYDVVHVHGYHDTPAAMAAWSWPGPLVFTPHFHGTSASRLRALLHVPYRAVGRRIVERADRILCVTGAEQRALVERFPGAASKSQVISNGVDVDRLRQAPVVARSDGRPSIVVASRLEDYKRVDLVVEAMHELDGSFVLEIYGDGPARSALAAQVTRWGLEADVELHGRVPDGALASGLRRARCLVSMSNHEAQGMVLLEAAAVGTPVVASSIPAHEEVARTMDGSVRLVPPNSDPATIADAVRQATGLPRVEHAVPSWSDVIARTEAVYRVILASEQKVGAAATWPP